MSSGRSPTPMRRAGILVAGIAAGLALCIAPPGGSLATAAPGHRPKALPAQVYAPYFETYQAGSITTTARRSGVRYYTLAFLQATRRHPCAVYWNGVSQDPVSKAQYLSQISTLRARGGDVIPSFGGYTADHDGTELADACTKVGSIAADYEQVVRIYGVSRLDFDIEDNSLGHVAGVTRRDKAIALLETWARARHLPLQVSFTMPATATGLATTGLAVLANAARNGTRVDVVNIMTFDYFDGTTKMGTAAIAAGTALHAQLAKLYPHKTSAQLYAMEAITLLPGIDDNPSKAEVTTLADARQVTTWAEKQHLAMLSIWAIQRDNGGCPGTVDNDSCSGVAQKPWAFSDILRGIDR
jgi:hypothetical protein